jgi:hypothetical protein
VDFSQRGGLWKLCGLAALLVASLFWAAGLTAHVGRAGVVPLWAAAAGLCLIYRPDPGSWQGKLVDSLEGLALLSLIGTLGALASYAIAALTTFYADDLLAAADRALGFDWVALYRLTGQYPLLSRLGQFGYASIFVSPMVLMIALHWTGRSDRARRFLFAFGVSLAVTLLIFALMPARAALAYHVGANPAYMPASGLGHVEVIEALRSGRFTRVDVSFVVGLIAFPSFHTASAILFIWAAWPIRWLRGPMLAANLLMLAATPIEGGHYLIDLAGGAAVAALGILSLRLMAPAGAGRKRPRFRLRAPPLAAPAG